MKSYQSWMFLFQKDTQQEEVTTVIGNTYLTHVSEAKPYKTGFFGLLVREDTPYRLIFFTSSGVKARRQTRVVVKFSRRKGSPPPIHPEGSRGTKETQEPTYRRNHCR